jgi:hypothetical protein
MTLPYVLKLLVLCLASFSLVHTALSLASKFATPAALRIAERIRPVRAARWLFLLRIIPSGVGVFVVVGLCVPSYLRLEPQTATSEEAGFFCCTFAALSVLLWGHSMVRALGAIARSNRWARHCELQGRETALPGDHAPAWIVEEPATLFAIAGILRPRLFISRQVLTLLSAEEFAAALGHERSHWKSRDNLKRLLLLSAPDLLPFVNAFRGLERGWAKYTERAADDQATGGHPRRTISLAAALVRVSRLGMSKGFSPLWAPLLAEDDDLPVRVDRLLNSAGPPGTDESSWRWLVAGAAVMLPGAAVLFAFQPALLYSVHRFLEYLI